MIVGDAKVPVDDQRRLVGGVGALKLTAPHLLLLIPY